MAEYRHSRVSDRDDEYRAKRRNLIISPERHDPFADGKLEIFIFALSNTLTLLFADSMIFCRWKNPRS